MGYFSLQMQVHAGKHQQLLIRTVGMQPGPSELCSLNISSKQVHRVDLDLHVFDHYQIQY